MVSACLFCYMFWATSLRCRGLCKDMQLTVLFALSGIHRICYRPRHLGRHLCHRFGHHGHRQRYRWRTSPSPILSSLLACIDMSSSSSSGTHCYLGLLLVPHLLRLLPWRSQAPSRRPQVSVSVLKTEHTERRSACDEYQWKRTVR
jgi:hypothetical protein